MLWNLPGGQSEHDEARAGAYLPAEHCRQRVKTFLQMQSNLNFELPYPHAEASASLSVLYESQSIMPASDWLS